MIYIFLNLFISKMNLISSLYLIDYLHSAETIILVTPRVKVLLQLTDNGTRDYITNYNTWFSVVYFLTYCIVCFNRQLNIPQKNNLNYIINAKTTQKKLIFQQYVYN